MSTHLNRLQPSRTLDLYCGVGTFTLPLARTAREVFAIEAQKSSLDDLRANVKRAHLVNVEIIGGDVGKRLKQLSPDLILVDPPRAGLTHAARTAIILNYPEHLIYISCNPATLARDTKEFIKAGYIIESLQCFDLFPHTPHVETLTVFSRSKNRKEVSQ